MRSLASLRLALLCAALASGCALAPPQADTSVAAESAWRSRAARLQALTGFELNGRLSASGAGLSGSLRWRQDGPRYALRLAGPFGAGALALNGDAGHLAIKGRDLDIDLPPAEAEAVLAQRSGWRLPLAALRYWVLGVPAPELAEAHQLDAQGRLLSLAQAGWTLRYSEYPDAGEAIARRIEMSRQDEAGDWRALLTVESLVLREASSP